MKTAHQLAKELLAGPDFPVFVRVDAGGDSVWADLGDARAEQTEHVSYAEPNENGERDEIVKKEAVCIKGWASDTPLRVDWDCGPF